MGGNGNLLKGTRVVCDISELQSESKVLGSFLLRVRLGLRWIGQRLCAIFKGLYPSKRYPMFRNRAVHIVLIVLCASSVVLGSNHATGKFRRTDRVSKSPLPDLSTAHAYHDYVYNKRGLKTSVEFPSRTALRDAALQKDAEASHPYLQQVHDDPNLVVKPEEAAALAQREPHMRDLPAHLKRNHYTILSHPPVKLTFDDIYHMTDAEIIDYVADLDLAHLMLDNKLRFLLWVAYDARDRRQRAARKRWEAMTVEERLAYKGLKPGEEEKLLSATERNQQLPEEPTEDGRRHPAATNEDTRVRRSDEEHDAHVEANFHSNIPKAHRAMHSAHREHRKAHGENIRSRVRPVPEHVPEGAIGAIHENRRVHSHSTSGQKAEVRTAHDLPPKKLVGDWRGEKPDWRAEDALAAKRSTEGVARLRERPHRTGTRHRRPLSEKLGQDQIRYRREIFARMTDLEQAHDLHQGDPSRCFAAAGSFCTGLMHDFASFINCVIRKRSSFERHDEHCQQDFVDLYSPCAQDLAEYCSHLPSADATACIVAHAENDHRVWERAVEASEAGTKPVANRMLDELRLSEECRSSELMSNMMVSAEHRAKHHGHDLPPEHKDVIFSQQEKHIEKQGGHEDEDPDFYWEEDMEELRNSLENAQQQEDDEGENRRGTAGNVVSESIKGTMDQSAPTSVDEF